MSNYYTTQNRWGGSTAAWHGNGLWIIGGRDAKRVTSVNVTSDDGGQTLSGTMTYEGEGPIGFEGTLIGDNQYQVENSWGGQGGQPGGVWVIGGRTEQNVVALDIESDDDGKTMTGTMVYDGEGSTSFRAQNTANVYTVENSWGGQGGQPGGTWVIGGRDSKNAVSVDISSDDSGETLSGTMTYQGEGPIGFEGTCDGANQYTVENSWGGEGGQPGGVWIIGGRDTKQVVSLNITSDDDGVTFSGKMTYQGEGAIGFEATRVDTSGDDAALRASLIRRTPRCAINRPRPLLQPRS